MANREFSLVQLAGQAGVAPRTVRFYIARGLLPGPVRGGRRAAYTAEHLERLEAIRRLQQRGLTLSEIARKLSGERPGDSLPTPSAWWSYPLDRDVVVWVRSDASPWRLRKIHRALARFAADLTEKEDSNGGS